MNQRFCFSILPLLIGLLVFTCSIKAQNLPVIVEAESGILGSDFEVVTEHGVTFVRSRTDMVNSGFPGNETRIITFHVPFVEQGNYDVFVRLRVGSGSFSDDSFFLGRQFGLSNPTIGTDWHNVNGFALNGHNIATQLVTGRGNVGTTTWKWLNISEFLNAANPVVYNVTATGQPMVLRIGARENGLDIDKIAFGKADLFYIVRNLDSIQPGSTQLYYDEEGFPLEAYRRVKTFINPVLPGDHPDITLFRKGNDFYLSGSTFHFTPYSPILHSTDLVHWRVITRVVPPTWPGLISDAPQGGLWQGVITYFYDSYWFYFSNTAGGGQHFARAPHPRGPWSTPVRMNTTHDTGPTGYDNSIFINEHGTPFLHIKPGRNMNRFQEIGTNGHLTGRLFNMDWINDDNRYSWAEGPVMFRRHGWYYYFIAGNVGGGQWVYRSQTLTDDSTQWMPMGPFFADITDPNTGFRGPNHMSAPTRLDNGTYWAFSHSYENPPGTSDWSGQGRQGLLHQITWDEAGKPTGTAPSTSPQLKPNLPKSGIPWNLPRSDYFENDSIELTWHFLNRLAASRYSLTVKPGWLTLMPGTGITHILHKESRHHFSRVTKVNFDAVSNGQQAGIYFTNGNESLTAAVYTGYNNGKKFGIRFGTVTYEIDNFLGNEVWLKAERYDHQLSGYYSSNGIEWFPIGSPIDISTLDMAQPNFNWWVGTSNGLFATGRNAHFDLYLFQDGFSQIPAIGYSNFFGLEVRGTGTNRALANRTGHGGWFMLGGIDLGRGARVPARVQVAAASVSGGTLEVWIGDLEGEGTQIATIEITSTGSNNIFQNFSAPVSGLSGQHDIYFRWNGPASAFLVKNVQFLVNEAYLTNIDITNNEHGWIVYPNPFKHGFTINTNNEMVRYRLYNLGGILLHSGTIHNTHYFSDKNLKSGIYLLHLYSDRITKIKKLIKID